jgi:hypothetical protein
MMIHFKVQVKLKYFLPLESVLARHLSRAADSLLRSSRGGGWGPPLGIGIQEVGTYIYSHTYTAYGALGTLL